jgi:Rhodopirellula transposase DDE domain
VKETDAIFPNLTEAHRRAAHSEETLRLSCDATAPVLIGPFSRGGKSRRGTRGADHDFQPWGKLTPCGIFLPDQKELNLYFTASKVTSDFIADRLDQWWQANRGRYPRIRKLLLDLDNGPENHSRRRQFIYRLVLWAQETQLTLELVYYPPYHSKYNPIERCWGVLEVYWNGELLDSEEAVLGFAANMTYAGRHSHVDRVGAAYSGGVRRSGAERKLLEGRLVRLPTLPKWSVTIAPPEPGEIILPS